ncbi:MAG: uracil-DNA glycosylase [Candidatus Paceibacterota bacterium]
MDDRAKKMRAVKKEVEALTRSPLCQERIKNEKLPVVGEGALDADIMLIGEAPGKNEAITGRPFCGAAGRILDHLFLSVGIQREDVYITSIVKDRPPNNRDPTPQEIADYAPFLDRQIEIIQPKVIATLGRFAMNYILERYGTPEMIRPISQNHGKKYKIQMTYGDIDVIPLYHPTATVYNKTVRKDLAEDFKILAKPNQPIK